MAKNTNYAKTNQYYNQTPNQAEQIRKAKGNPNKNNHAKKKNSNYKGYNATGTGAYVANKLSQKAANREKVNLPLKMKIILGVLFGAVVVTLILRMAAFKDSLWLTNISSLLLGIACLVLFYVRKHYHQKKSGAGYSMITLILTIFGVLYTVIGLGGILSLLGVF